MYDFNSIFPTMASALCRRLALPFCLLVLAPRFACADGMKWVNSFAEAQTLARKSNKIIMLDLYRKGEKPHDKLIGVTFKDKRIVKFSKNFVLAQVEESSEEGRMFSRMFSVHNYPVTFFVGASTQLWGFIGGSQSPSEYLKKMQDFLGFNKHMSQWIAKGGDTKNLDANASLAYLFASRGDVGAANQYMRLSESVDPNNKRGKLTDAYLAFADITRIRGNTDTAVAYYKKAANSAKQPGQIVSAKVGWAVSVYRKDPQSAEKLLNESLAVKGISADDKAAVQSLITRLKNRR